MDERADEQRDHQRPPKPPEEPPPGFLQPLLNPSIDPGTSWAFARLRTCEFMKRWEHTSKSSVIDSFTVKSGLPRGAHRATDHCHDPLLGFFRAAKEMGWKEASKKWPKHMASDAVTPRSLPVPGSSLMSADSWVVQLYSKGLLNFRTTVVVPWIGVGVTELETRLRNPDKRGDELDLVVQEAHLTSMAISALSATALGLVAPKAAAALIVALAAAAFWEGFMAGCYWIKRHRHEIADAARRVTTQVTEAAKEAVRAHGDVQAIGSAPSRREGAEVAPASTYEVPSRVALTAAAVALTFLLLVGKPGLS